MIFILLSFACFFIFRYEIKLFPYQINQQIYNEYWQLCTCKRGIFYDFLQKSSLQPKASYYSYYWLMTLLVLNCIFSIFHCSYILFIFLAILILLSIIDALYYLTSVKYITLLFFLSVASLLYADFNLIQARLANFLSVSLVFLIVIPFIEKLAHKSYLGSGDSLLLIALSPLFEIVQMAQLLLIASLSALGYALLVYCYRKSLPMRLPFIPFISFSTFCLFIVKLPLSILP